MSDMASVASEETDNNVENVGESSEESNNAAPVAETTPTTTPTTTTPTTTESLDCQCESLIDLTAPWAPPCTRDGIDCCSYCQGVTVSVDGYFDCRRMDDIVVETWFLNYNYDCRFIRREGNDVSAS